LREPRLRQQRELLVARAEHVDETAHLLQRLAARALDRHERAFRLRRVGSEDPASAVRLQDDHAERVTDDVVELAGDPGSLFLDGSAPVLLAAALEDDGSLLEQMLSLASVPDRPPENPRRPAEQPEEQDAREIPVASVVGHD